MASESRSVIRIIGSLWFAAVLLVLWLVAMACATVYEADHGSTQALLVFYKSWWFNVLLALLTVNALMALIVRYPFSKRQIGFVMTHLSIPLILGGAVVTKYVGIDGHVNIEQGKTAGHVSVSSPALTVLDRINGARESIPLSKAVFGGLRKVTDPPAPQMHLGNLQARIQQYLPDSEWIHETVDDNPTASPAVEVLFASSGEGSHSEHEYPTWVFDGKTVRTGHTSVAFRVVRDQEEFAGLLVDSAQTQPATEKTIRITYQGRTFNIPLQQGREQAVPLGETGVTARVLRYFPHAMVGTDGKIHNASSRAVNPAIEVELASSGGREKRLAFAKFPDFGAMYSKDHIIKDLKLVFVADAADARTPIEVFSGPDGKLAVRFNKRDGRRISRTLTVGTPIDSPWPAHTFAVLRRFERARIKEYAQSVEPVRKERTPAMQVRVQRGDDVQTLWLQRYRPQIVHIGGGRYELAYGNQTLPLGFTVTLNRFHLGYYPGGRRPRSFESQITITDPRNGRTQTRVVSMNHPTTYAGYTFYQSGYEQKTGRTSSTLSVANDPGKPIVFAGYILLMAGMLVVLITAATAKRERK